MFARRMSELRRDGALELAAELVPDADDAGARGKGTPPTVGMERVAT